MKMNIWKKIFNDILFSDGKVPSPEEKKKFYDKCFRRTKRSFKKMGLTPTKAEFTEELEDCLRDVLYRYQLEPEKPRKNVGTVFSTERRNREREARELEEDIRALNKINRDFFNPDREDLEKKREEQRKKDKAWIEDKIRSESGGS